MTFLTVKKFAKEKVARFSGLLWTGRILCFLAALLTAPPALAQANLPDPLDSYVREAMTQAEVPGLAIAVVHGEDPPIAEGFGVRRLGRSEPVDAETRP